MTSVDISGVKLLENRTKNCHLLALVAPSTYKSGSKTEVEAIF
jgi:hypothetical protein